MHALLFALEFVRHLDVHLNSFATAHPLGVYVLLVAIVFCETGLVVTPFLPGDSLLFALGSLAAMAGSPINLPLVIVLLCLAANCGDLVNYTVGRRVGPAIFSRETTFLLNKRHLMEAQAFYDRHGRKTIILARFVPIIRTFAPFVAGVGRMRFSRFVGFSIAGGLFWVLTVTLAGYRFGRIEAIRGHFELVVVAIVAISLIPLAVTYLRARKQPVRGFAQIAEKL